MTQPNLIVHGSWQLSSIALKILELDEGKTRLWIEERKRDIEGREGCKKAR